jgi:hypothetical protein
LIWKKTVTIGTNHNLLGFCTLQKKIGASESFFAASFIRTKHNPMEVSGGKRPEQPKYSATTTDFDVIGMRAQK